MPDHLHMIWMGLRQVSDQLNAITFFRTHLSRVLSPWELQHQAYDHVMRDEERRQNAFALTCSYILANPVTKKFVLKVEEWKYSGAMVPGFPDWPPFKTLFWERFWRRYRKTKDPGSRLVRPRDRLPEGKKPEPERTQDVSEAT